MRAHENAPPLTPGKAHKPQRREGEAPRPAGEGRRRRFRETTGKRGLLLGEVRCLPAGARREGGRRAAARRHRG